MTEPGTRGGKESHARSLLAASLLIAAACCAPPSFAREGPAWEELERQGALVDRIEFETYDVFDTSDPEEDHFVGRAANAIHIRSREGLFRRELLFAAGDAVDARLIRETERNLRRLSYVNAARIVPVVAADGGVTARVVVHDAWSLRTGVKLRYQGGDGEWGATVEEVNLLGRGKTLRLWYDENRERSRAEIYFKDPRLFGSRLQLRGGYSDLSDGRSGSAALSRPFYSLDTPWAFAASLYDEETSIPLYEGGEEADRYPARFEGGRLELWKSLARGKGWALRAGIEYRDEVAKYGTPHSAADGPPAVEAADRDLQGVVAHGQYLQDRHEMRENLTAIGRTEDLNFGWDLHLWTGGYFRELGSGERSLTAGLSAAKHWRAGERSVARFTAVADGRRRDGSWENTLFGVDLSWFDQRFPRQTLVAQLRVDGVLGPAPERVLTMGASDGLRGYANDVLSSDRRVIVTLEDRLVSERVLLGMAQVGFVLFADAGAVRRIEDGEWSRIFADVGGGLRIGNLKSAFGSVVLATVAFPLVEGEGAGRYEIFLGNEIPF